MEGIDESLEGLILWQWDLESEEREGVSLRWRKWFSGSASRSPYIAWALSLVLPSCTLSYESPGTGFYCQEFCPFTKGPSNLRSHEQNKPFFFLSCLYQVFAYSGAKATNKIFFIFLEFCLDIQIGSWFWKGEIYIIEIAEFMCVNGC